MATARDCGRGCGHGIDGFFTAINRGRLTRETSNCRKMLPYCRLRNIRATLWSRMPTSGARKFTRGRNITHSLYNTAVLHAIMQHYRILNIYFTNETFQNILTFDLSISHLLFFNLLHLCSLKFIKVEKDIHIKCGDNNRAMMIKGAKEFFRIYRV